MSVAMTVFSTMWPSWLWASLGQEHLVRGLLGRKAFRVGNERKTRAT